jgi:hypothetical protein
MAYTALYGWNHWMHPASSETASRSRQLNCIQQEVIQLSIGFIDNFRRCIRFAPLAIISLIMYAALRSSSLVPEDYSLLWATWHPAYRNWWDILLICSIMINLFSSRVIIQQGVVAFLYLMLLFILLSLIVGSSDWSLVATTDALIYWLRFAFVFSLSVCLTERLGKQATEVLLIVLFTILCVSALAVYQLRFGEFNRIYASAMTVASFSQVAVVILFIAITIRHYFLLIFALCFLFLTFSLTSIALFLILFSIYIMNSNTLSYRERILSLILVGTIIVVGLFGAKASQQFEVIYDSWDPQFLSTLDGRLEIWSYGVSLLGSGSVGFFGVGFQRSPLFLNQVFYTITDTDSFIPAIPHFHSIFLEYGLGLGIPSLIVFYILVRRIIQTWHMKCHPAGLIFAFFLLSQALDFTFYRPKEVIMWAVMLGLAEGQWRQERCSSALT